MTTMDNTPQGELVAILAKEIAHGRVVTVRVEGMTFLRPVAVGDVVCCYARCVKRGTTSISINIEVWVKKVASEPIGQRYKATEALFIYVAVPFRRKIILTTSPEPGLPAS